MLIINGTGWFLTSDQTVGSLTLLAVLVPEIQNKNSKLAPE